MQRINFVQNDVKYDLRRTYVFITNAQHEITSFIVNFGHSWPIVVGHGCLVAKHDDATRSEAQEVLDAVLALQGYPKIRINLENTYKFSTTTCKMCSINMLKLSRQYFRIKL